MIKVELEDGTIYQHPDGDGVELVLATSQKPKPGYTKVSRTYPPEYVKCGTIAARNVVPNHLVRIYDSRGYLKVVRVSEA